jgi:hypothetical protein
MKKAEGYSSEACAEVGALVNLATQLLHSKEINRADLNEMLRQCESLKIAIQAKLVKLAN